MFVKITKSGGHTYLKIVESYRNDKGASKHRVLYNLGRLDSLKLDTGFVNCVKKLCNLLEIPIQEDRAAFEQCSEAVLLNYGYLAYTKLWERLGIQEILERIGRDSRSIRLDLQRTVLLMAVQHLLAPRSKLGTYARQHQYYGAQHIPLQHFYRALDKLADNKEMIEQALFQRNHLKVNQQVDIVFYDVTTFAFQSTNRDELRNFGFSKDCRFNEVQVVMGLLLDGDGMPLGYELFPGNTFDGRTMVRSLENLKKKFKIRRVVIVADRGLNSKGNLEMIRQAGYGYIMACRLRSMPAAIQQAALDQTTYTAVGEDFKYKTISYLNCFKDEEGRTHEMSENLVLSWSLKRAAKDGKDRQRLIDKANKMLENPASIQAASKRGGKRYLKDESGKQANWMLDERRIEQDSRLDGYYGIQTSEKEMSAGEVMDAYHMLWRIEDSFRVMKSTLEVRPIFHWVPERIKGHFVMCFLAFMMQRKLESLLPAPEDEALTNSTNSPDRIREALLSMQLAEIEVNGQTVFLKTKHLPLAGKIFHSLGLKTPKNVSYETQLRQIFDSLRDGYDGQMSMF